jgi:hypothetical protein
MLTELMGREYIAEGGQVRVGRDGVGRIPEKTGFSREQSATDCCAHEPKSDTGQNPNTNTR